MRIAWTDGPLFACTYSPRHPDLTLDGVARTVTLFIGEANAGHRSAVIYTLIESCRRRGLDPFAYLKDVLTRLPKATNWNIGELTPAALAAAQKRVAACAA